VRHLPLGQAVRVAHEEEPFAQSLRSALQRCHGGLLSASLYKFYKSINNTDKNQGVGMASFAPAPNRAAQEAVVAAVLAALLIRASKDKGVKQPCFLRPLRPGFKRVDDVFRRARIPGKRAERCNGMEGYRTLRRRRRE